MSKNRILIIVAIVGVFIIIGLLAAFFFIPSGRVDTNGDEAHFSEYETIDYELEGSMLTLLVADTDEKREQGLMGVTNLELYDGMIFQFDEVKSRRFWNEGTLMDLTVYWINGEEVIGTSQLPKIEEGQETTIVRSPQPVDLVIELPR